MLRLKGLALPALSLVAAALAACGGSSGDAGQADPTFVANAPTFDKVSMQLDEADAAAAAAPATALEQDAAIDKCHPHLFSRAHEVIVRINRHSNKLLARVKDLIADRPKTKTSATHVWEKADAAGVDQKLTLTKTQQDQTYTFQLDLRRIGSSKSTRVSSGTISSSSAANVATTQVTMTLDFDALKSVVATEQALGQINFFVTITSDPSKPAPGVRKTASLALINFVPDDGDPLGPRGGNYSYVGEPGQGGVLRFADSLSLACPTALVADTQVVARWYKAADGGTHGRADGIAAGGQVPAGQNWVGASCHNGQPGQATTKGSESAYWMSKLEDAGGATIDGSGSEASDGFANPCDTAFGAMPTLAGSSKDFDFNQQAVMFPSQW